ncbi:TIR domain-containing protein [Serratia ureilytica]|uniref:TIR domain-containing protein n=1 Tax=Serratia ureilytica TaxID=300181 RepID=UPI002DBB698E|nr:TIR domain-containing protein [Serratia ureilytica]MEB5993775.1 TIR domain-containing protein [Serratia ureilytica]
MSTYNVFISHSWNYGDFYTRLVDMLHSKPGFSFKNYSVPEENPIFGAKTDRELEAAIEVKMRLSSVVLIMAGVYSTYSKWINIEIDMAKRLGKPIIAIKPFGAERISAVVRAASHKECAWNTNSITQAIIDLA